MWQAVLTFYGVILGATVAGGVALWQALLAGQREREARQFEREQVRKEAHDAFQRDSISALHDAVGHYWELVLDAFSFYRSAGAEEDQRLRSIVVPMNAAYSRLLMARAKVFDDELRRLVKEFDKHAGVAASPTTSETASSALAAGNRLLEQMEERVNVLLKGLV
jgi:hypothetical protein